MLRAAKAEDSSMIAYLSYDEKPAILTAWRSGR
jgi:hypothetical protein